MSQNHFRSDYSPIPRRGLTPVEAAEYLKEEFPHISSWTLYFPPTSSAQDALKKIVGKGYQTGGSIGTWKWARAKSSYPSLAYWEGNDTKASESDDWLGVLQITGIAQEEFLVFSFMNSKGTVGECYMFSTLDVGLIQRFMHDIEAHFSPKDQLTITVWGGSDIRLPLDDDERIFLPDALRHDIESQVLSFFGNAKSYEKLKLRHRRGILFVGSPGNGKTMLLRHLARKCHLLYQVHPVMLAINGSTDDGDVRCVFRAAARRTPTLLILEDVDSLSKDSKVSRSTLLNELDGLNSKSGILVIGTTNHPEQIDSALVHRPSRFDRVWHFPLPDLKMRLNYLKEAFPDINQSVVQIIAEETDDWSFAYLNELRTTAAILCMDRQNECVLEQDLENAHDLLAAQFQAGRKNHIISESEPSLGFKAA
jgi:hypothetical protein